MQFTMNCFPVLHGSGLQFDLKKNKLLLCGPALVCNVGKHNILGVRHCVYNMIRYDQLLLPFSWGGHLAPPWSRSAGGGSDWPA